MMELLFVLGVAAAVIMSFVILGEGMGFAAAFVIIVTSIAAFPHGQEFIKYKEVQIHSSAGSNMAVYGSFVLGTGFIDSKEFYKANIYKNGGYQRVYIPVEDTIRIEKPGLTSTAIWKIPMCKERPGYLFENNKLFECKNTNIDTFSHNLIIPVGTIVQEINFQ